MNPLARRAWLVNGISIDLTMTSSQRAGCEFSNILVKGSIEHSVISQELQFSIRIFPAKFSIHIYVSVPVYTRGGYSNFPDVFTESFPGLSLGPLD